MIFGKCLRKKPFLQGYKPSCNLAYVFARNKPCLFHSEKFILQLSEGEKCEVHAVKGGN